MPRSARRSVCLALVALFAAACGPARAAERPPAAHANAGYGAALPRFALFGWVSPPRDSTTPARYAELAATGFNVTVLAADDSGTVADNLLRLDATRPTGVRNLLLDNELDLVSAADTASLALADTIVSRYRDDPAFLGYYLGDEPAASVFPRLGEWFGILRTRDPDHPAWNDLPSIGAFASQADFQAYVEEYVAATHPAVLCNNHYDFRIDGDALQLTENIATLAAVARANDLPFWGIVQLVEHWVYRHVTEGMLRWQVAQWLAWGARGIGYFTYWTPGPPVAWQLAMIAWDTGAQTPYYDMVKTLNARLAPLGNTLAGMQWLRTEHAGSVPPGGVPFAPDAWVDAVEGRATLGRFADSTGTACVFVANADSLAPQTVTLTLVGPGGASRLSDDGSTWDSLAVDAGGRVALTLDAGDFVLLRLTPTPSAGVDGPRGGGAGGLGLRATPNPARGSMRFEVTGADGAVRLELRDLAGRSHLDARAGARLRRSRMGGRARRGRARAGGGVLRAGRERARVAGAPRGLARRALGNSLGDARRKLSAP